MRWWMVAAVPLVGHALPAMAQEFPGAIIASYYMEEFSTPKGWTLSYKGREGGVQVFIMDRDLDSFPQTAFMSPLDQLRRVMCGDDTLKQMVASGTRVRVDARDRRDGKVKVERGETLSRC